MDNSGRLAWGLARGKLSGRDTWHQGPNCTQTVGTQGPPTLGCSISGNPQAP